MNVVTSRAVVKNGKISIASDYSHKDRCKSVRGARWNPELKVWQYDATPDNASALRQAFKGARFIESDDFKTLADRGIKIQEKREEALDKIQQVKQLEDAPPIPYIKSEAWKHQRLTYHMATHMPAFGLWLDMGTGKSLVAAALVIRAVEEDNARRILIMCPKSVVPAWKKQFKLHTDLGNNVILLQDGSVPEKANLAKRAHNKYLDVPLVFVINYDSARGKEFADWALSIQWDYVICDESHKIKNPMGVTAKFCHAIAKKSKRRLALSGTPAPHNPLDVFSQYKFLDTKIFGDRWGDFKSRYAIFGGWMNKQIVGFRNTDDLFDRVYSIAYRVKSEDVLDLPPFQHITRPVYLAGEAAELYEQLEEDFYIKVDDGEVTAKNALVQLLRLQQITGGHIIDDEGNTRGIGSYKADVLEEVLEELQEDEPVVIFARFSHDIQAIKEVCKKLSRSVGELSGKRNDLNSWQNGELNALVVQIQSGGAGIDLTRSRYCIYYSLGFSLGDYDQSLKRTHRPGQTRNTTYIHLVAQKTVDEKVYNALQNRKEVIESVLETRTYDSGQ